MIAPAVRVRTLRITAPEEALVRRGVNLVADALAMASLPGLPPNSLVFIRRLVLGRFSASMSHAALARWIDWQVARLSAVVVRGDRDRPDADAVWFADPLEPYLRLADLLERGVSPTSWYWSAAVSEWRPGAGARQSYRQILQGLSATPGGAIHVGRLLHHLMDRSGAEQLLGSLKPEDAWRLARAFDPPSAPAPLWPAATERAASALLRLPPAWQAALTRWIRRWGEGDVRSRWLAQTALVAANPAALLDRRLGNFAQELCATAVASGEAGTARATVRPRERERQAEPQELSKTRPSDSLETPAPGLETLPKASEISRQVGRLRVLDEPNVRQAADGAVERLSTASERGGPDEAASSHPLLPFSESCGLPLLVPLFERLGIGTVLAEHPELAACNLPARLLHAVAERLGIPREDPVRVFIPALPEADLDEDMAFVAPAAWQSIAFGARGRVLARRRVVGRPQRRLLTDASGRLVLARWQGHRPALADVWLTGDTVRLLPPASPRPLIGQIEQAFLLAMSRFVRRYAGMGWRSLVRRPGKVVTTHTHLDVVFDHDQADLRLRRCGLDLDPGWVPWLGRVVQFHYAYDRS